MVQRVVAPKFRRPIAPHGRARPRLVTFVGGIIFIEAVKEIASAAMKLESKKFRPPAPLAELRSWRQLGLVLSEKEARRMG